MKNAHISYTLAMVIGICIVGCTHPPKIVPVPPVVAPPTFRDSMMTIMNKLPRNFKGEGRRDKGWYHGTHYFEDYDSIRLNPIYDTMDNFVQMGVAQFVNNPVLSEDGDLIKYDYAFGVTYVYPFSGHYIYNKLSDSIFFYGTTPYGPDTFKGAAY